jgi:serine/threonine protein kinase
MGMVFEAEDTHLQRRVALKVMRPELAAPLANRTRFLKEARAAAAITSDHVVTVYQIGQDNDVPFLAMQLLQGEPLDARLAREGRLPLVEALTVGIRAAAGLAAAHDMNLVHRDIKPANLWLEADRPGAAFRPGRVRPGGRVAPRRGPGRGRVRVLDECWSQGGPPGGRAGRLVFTSRSAGSPNRRVRLLQTGERPPVTPPDREKVAGTDGKQACPPSAAGDYLSVSCRDASPG